MIFREAVEYLEKSNIENASFEVSLIFEKLFDLKPFQLPLVKDKDFESPELSDILSKRAENYPLQYLLGSWEFFGLEFKVDENCLCPRADTEILVEKAIEILPENAKILELCTGSGCIPVAICKERKDVSCRSTDIFEKTLELAEENAKKHSVSDRVKFTLADVFDFDIFTERKKEFLFGGEKLDAVISNPPYIKTAEIAKLSKEVRFEPHSALDGGDDGLSFYRAIVKNYGKYLKPSGVFIFEIGFDQDEDICRIAEENKYNCKITKDYGGNPRVAVVYKNN